MTLAGVPFERWTLPRILDVCFVLLVEVYQAMGANLIEAIDKAKSLGGSTDGVTAAGSRPPAPPDNDQSLALLEAMMAGTR